MKKILSTLLAILLLIPANMTFAAEKTSEAAVPVVYSEDIKILNSFGIFEADFFANPSDFITRGQLAYISDVMSGMDLKYDTVHYHDVTADYKYASSVEAASRMKVMDDYIDGSFRADEKITLEQAFKAMVVLTGYSFMAEKDGGDYNKTAYSLGINSGIKLNVKNNVTFEQMATIIMNTFETDIARITYSDENTFIKDTLSDETLLSSEFDIYRERGTIEATYISSLNSAIVKASENSFSVNGAEYDQGAYNTELLLGYQVEFFYQHDEENQTKQLLYLFEDEDFNDVITIPAEDCEGVSNRTLNYYEKGRAKKFVIGATCDIILNGKLQIAYDESLFDLSNGEICIVTNERNNKTFLSIKSVSEFVIGYVGQTQISTKLGGKSIEISDSDELGFKQSITRGGKEIDITKVAENNILEVYTDGLLPDGSVDLTDAEFIIGTATLNKITGYINAMYEDYIRVDGTNYEISKTLEDSIANGYIEAPLMAAQYDLYLNSYGQISYYVRKVTNNERLGIVLRTRAYEDDDGEPTGYVKILEDNGTVTQYEIPKEIKVDGVAKRSPEDFVRNFDSLAKNVKNTETGEIMQIVLPPKRFIRYVTRQVPDEGNIIIKENADGTKTEEQVMKTVLIELDTIVENPTPMEGDMVYEHTVPYGSWKRYKSGMMGNAFKVESTTKLFYIPRITSRTSNEDTTTDTLTWTGLDVEDPDNYGVGSSKFNQAGQSTWFGDIYTYMMNEESVPRAAAAYPRKTSGTAKVDIDGSASGSGRISGFQTVVNEDDEVVLQLMIGTSTTVMIEPGEEDTVLQCAKQPYMADGVTPRIAKEGDFIRYWKDVKGYLIGVDICISVDDMKAGIPKINSLNASGTSLVQFQAQYVQRFLYGLPYRVGTSTMKIAKKAQTNEAGDYIYDTNGNLMYDFDSGSSSFEVFPANATVYLMEETSTGKFRWSQVSKGEIRTYENHGYNADRVIIASGYGGISYVVIVRLYN